ncbi:MAG: replication-associated recombination protein A [Pseudomonadota bacterium]|nr:replication-associated recombination protein A [Pseudomonadota bacterium]
MATLFETNAYRPLADQLRPDSLGEILGQDHLLGPEGPLGRMVNDNHITSVIMWGPPGTGKTTIARLLGRAKNFYFEQISAVFSGVSDLRRIFESAKKRRVDGQNTLLFVDEIHRFNRAQQDGFLPFIEDGTIVLVGATTQNPSFELNGALLSRCKVLVLKPLGAEVLSQLLSRAENVLGQKLPLTREARVELLHFADGDGRYLLNLVEEIFALGDDKLLDVTGFIRSIQKRAPQYDRSQEAHYNLTSALHKSLRGSDVDAALYWLARMLLGGEDPLYIMRRLTRFSVEDIGLADPSALSQSIAAWQAFERIGSPEGELAIAQCVIYLATAPKSNSVYRALTEATRSAQKTGSLTPPKHILNASTSLLEEIGYGKGYQYDHEAEGAFSGQNYFPEEMERGVFFEPNYQGFENEIAERLKAWTSLRQQVACDDD